MPELTYFTIGAYALLSISLMALIALGAVLLRGEDDAEADLLGRPSLRRTPKGLRAELLRRRHRLTLRHAASGARA
jgi:hypothetical protein